MGNRAYVVFENGDDRSPAVYLHWNGGPESIYAFLQVLKEYGALNHSPGYSCARFIQLVGNFMGGTLSLGVNTFKDYIDLDCGDNGLYVVTPHEVRRFLDPREQGLTDADIEEGADLDFFVRWLRPEQVQREHDAAINSRYWLPEPGQDSILELLRQANDAVFLQPVAA